MRYSEIDIKYNQLNKGFFQLGFSRYKHMENTFSSFRKFETGIGYSPWKKSFIIEQDFNLVFFHLSVGFGGGYCGSVHNPTTGMWFIKPQLGITFLYVQVSYAYSFLSITDASLYNKGSNIIISIPLCSTYRYNKIRDKKRYHFGGVLPVILKDMRNP